MPPTSKGNAPGGAKVCGRDWSTYNKRATSEVPEVLNEIKKQGDAIRLPKQQTSRGQRPFALRSLLKCWLAMTFFNLSSRRAIGFLKTHREELGLRSVPHFNTLTRRARDPRLLPVLQQLIQQTRASLDHDEQLVSVDATGIATTHGKRWIDEKRGAGNDWRKLHALHDVETGLFLSVEVTDARTHDSLAFPPLAGDMREGSSMLGDRGYLSRENIFLIEYAGGVAYIRPKKNTKIRRYKRDGLSRLARRAKKRAWWKVYRRRNSHESRFSMLKRVVKPILRWKSDEGRDAELLLAAITHNLRVITKRAQ